MKKILLLLLCCLSLSQAMTEYKLMVKGYHAGKAELKININNGNYEINLALFPSLLAKILGINDMNEIAKGIIVSNHYYPKTYQRHTTKGSLLFAVNFFDNIAKQSNKGKVKTIKKNPQAQDPLTQLAQVQHDLRYNSVGLVYHLITEKSQRIFSAKIQSSQQENLVILTEYPQPNRIINLWFDKNHQLLRMQKIKRGKVQFDMIKK